MKGLFLNLMLLLGLMSLSLNCSSKSKKEAKLQAENAKKVSLEQFRPLFHFTPKEKWMNDPNGLVYHNGEYHLFYQYYPDSTVWGPMHWGHAKSKDLLKWKHQDIALYPDSLGYIFSGSAVIDVKNTAGFGENAMVAAFTYHDPIKEKDGQIDFQTQGIAHSNDNGKTWTKYEGNPVIKNPGIRDFRDPKVFWNVEKSNWQMVLVAKDEVQFYESMDLKSWNKISVFRFDDNPPLGVWECPDIFKMKVENTEEEKWVLIVSHGQGAANGGSGTRYFIGDYDGTTFTTQQKSSQWLDYGTDNYAGVTYNNTPDGKRIFIGWMSNWDYATTTPTIRWRSAMTLPRELTLNKNENGYYVKSSLIEQIGTITTDVSSEVSGTPDTQFTYADLQRSLLSYDITDITHPFEISLSNSKEELYTISYDPKSRIFSTDRSKSGNIDFNKKFLKNPKQRMTIGARTQMSLTLVLDASSIEIFVNDGEFVMTNQIFPSEPYTKFHISKGPNTKMENFEIKKIKHVVPQE